MPSIQQSTTKYKQKKVNLKIVDHETERVKEEAEIHQVETSSSSRTHLAVCGTVKVRLGANDTVGDQVGV